MPKNEDISLKRFLRGETYFIENLELKHRILEEAVQM